MPAQPFNFTGRDLTAEYERLLAFLKAELPEYTDWNHSDAGIVILRLLARETDQLNNFIDFVGGEGFVPTAQFRSSLIKIGRTVDYLPTLAAAASTRLRLTRRPGVTEAISVPQWSEFNRADGTTYLTTAAVTVPGSAGVPAGDHVDVNAVQGIMVERTFDATDFKITDWTKHPRVNLGKSVAGGGFTSVWVAPASAPVIQWTEVDSFWRSGPDDLHDLLELNGDTDDVWLVLGDGTKGSLPPTDTLHVRFIRTAEAAGNCGHSTIYGIPDGFSDLITATNIEPATGGGPAESTESIRSMIPRMVRTQRRGLTKSDYETLLEHFPGVLHVQAQDRNDNLYWPHDYMAIHVVPDGGGPMSTFLKEAIWAQCGSWGHLGPWKERYILLDATVVPVSVLVRIGILPGFVADTVKAAVEAAIAAILTPQNRTIGGTLEFTELHRVVSAIPGVSWAEFDAPKEDQRCKAGEIFVPGVIAVTVG